MGSPPTDTKGIEISPTRIRKFRSECARRWAYGALYDWREPETDALRFGSALHKVAERWYKEGLLPDQKTKEGALFSTAIHLLPAPGDNVHSELPVKFPPVNGFETPGTADLVEVLPPASPSPAPCVVLYDYKTSAAVKWVKTEAQLLADEQVNCYGLAVMLRFNVTWIRCQWVYMIKDGSPPVVVDFTLTKKKALAFWEKNCAPAVVDMLAAYEDTPETAEAFEPTYQNCNAFRKECTYKKQCDKYQRKDHQMSANALFEKLKAKQAAAKAPVETPVETPIETPAQINAPEGAQPLPVEPPAKKKKTKKAAKAPVPAAGGMIVLVGCLQTKGAWPQAVNLTELAAPAMEAAALSEDAPDWRLIDFRASGSLAYHFEQQLLAEPFEGVVFVDRFSAEGKALLSTLEKFATAVIKGGL